MTQDIDKLTNQIAIVSFLPLQDGDGYSWGGGTILTIGEQSVPFGSGKAAQQLAEEIARRWNESGRSALAEGEKR